MDRYNEKGAISSFEVIPYVVFYGNDVLWKVVEKAGKSIRLLPQLTTILGKVGKSVRLFHIPTKLRASDY